MKKKANVKYFKLQPLAQDDEKYKGMFEYEIANPNPINFRKLSDSNIRYRQWSINNASYCLSRFGANIKNIFDIDLLNEYGLTPEFTMQNISKDNRGTKGDFQKYPMPFSQPMYEDMLACAKIKLCPTERMLVDKRELVETASKECDDVFEAYTNWYAGVVRGKAMIFKEVISYPYSGALFDKTGCKRGNPTTSGSYELKAMVAGNNDLMCELIRLDYNPRTPHCNNIHKNKTLLNEPKSVVGSHCHYANEKFNVAFPYEFNHGESYLVDSSGLTFAQSLLAVKDAVNIKNNEPLFNDSHSTVSIYNVCKDIPYETLNGSFGDRLWRGFKIHKKEELKDKTANVSADLIATGEVLLESYSEMGQD